MTTAILGGGIAGLEVAARLKQCSPIYILEKRGELGGLCRSFFFMGFHYDIGPHIFFSRNPAVLNYVISASDGLMVKHKRHNQVFIDGCLVDYPFENYLGMLPVTANRNCLETFLDNPYSEIVPGNMLEFFLNRFGEGITELYLRPYNEKIWKYDPAHLDLQMVARIPHPPSVDVIAGANKEYKEGYVHQAEFWYPKMGGADGLIKCLADKLPESVSVNLDMEVSRIRPVQDGFVIEANGVEWANAETIVNCMPLHELFKILDLNIPAEIYKTVESLKFNSLYYGVVVFESDNVGDILAVTFPAPEIIFHRLTKLNSLGQNRDQKHTAFLFEVTFREGTTLASLSSQEILTRVVDSVESIGFAKKAEFLDGEVRKEPYAYVIYDIHHRKNTDKVLEYLRGMQIHCCGRFAQFEYLNTDQVIEQAINLTANINKEVEN